MYIVSGCLAGLCCRYDGGDNADERVMKLVAQGKAIPVCPEQLGGLTTPRPPCEIVNGKVLSNEKADVTGNFMRGAEEALKLAQLAGSKKAILKARSPSCGIGKIYDGTFSGTLIEGDGLFAAMLRKEGFELETE
ncbi:DUF523 domain-containing protein [Desulfovibrio sp. JC010]|uniref:DUF523 domain-containing protein n=1 Tax=Desulfovibrio sp. JC010 TaxID=2593641 RepID=UPI0013D3900D|nr:DUF523 domain-containing protein [Desulfovibrio sp. JC010]NDV25352.1 DUF523 domain-containing protein [Desulfovibrio sp. JC010]